MNNNPGVFTEDIPLKKLFLFIFLLTICFQKNILRHDYLLADEVISHKKNQTVSNVFKKRTFQVYNGFPHTEEGSRPKIKVKGLFLNILHILIFLMGYHLISYI